MKPSWMLQLVASVLVLGEFSVFLEATNGAEDQTPLSYLRPREASNPIPVPSNPVHYASYRFDVKSARRSEDQKSIRHLLPPSFNNVVPISDTTRRDDQRDVNSHFSQVHSVITKLMSGLKGSRRAKKKEDPEFPEDYGIFDRTWSGENSDRSTTGSSSTMADSTGEPSEASSMLSETTQPLARATTPSLPIDIPPRTRSSQHL